MFENMNEQQAREEILKQVAAYCDKYHNTEKRIYRGTADSVCVPRLR